MTLTLILTRHAKSDWDAGVLSDHDRPLNERGREAAKKVGGWIASNDFSPEKVLVSDARRTRETYALVASAFDKNPEVDFAAKLYHAVPGAVLQEIEAQANASPLLVIGHNPGFAMLAEYLAREPAKHARFYDYPTCATTVFEFEIDDWSEISLNNGRVVSFVIPREL